MRKNKYETSVAKAWEIFDASPFATLACKRKNGNPYAVNLSMARIGETLYFHCANEGEKNDGFQLYPQVCVSAVSKNVVVEEMFTVKYESVILDGTIQMVADREEKLQALKAICERFTPSVMERFQSAAEKSIDITSIYKIEVQTITGKAKF